MKPSTRHSFLPVAFRRLLLAAGILAGLGLRAAEPSATGPSPWEFTPDPALPNVLILGDSISTGYTLPVRELLRGKANVFRPVTADGKQPTNCGDSRFTLERIDSWLGDRKWSVIHCNWGIHDSTYRNRVTSRLPGHQDKVTGKISVPIPLYRENLDRLFTRLQATGARVIWASTTVIPPDEFGHYLADQVEYNGAAADVARRHGLAIDDLYQLTRSFPGRYFVGPADVHYTDEGYAAIAAQVAASIERELARK